MNDFAQREPESLERVDPVGAALDRVARGDDDGDDLSIDFTVAGGAPSQRFHLALHIAGREVRSCSYDCDMSDRHEAFDPKQASAKGRELVGSLVERLAGTGVLAARYEQPMFLPDTIIGTIVVTVGGEERRIRFAADPDQAEVQDLRPPAEVIAAVEAFYDTAGQVLGMDDVRP